MHAFEPAGPLTPSARPLQPSRLFTESVPRRTGRDRLQLSPGNRAIAASLESSVVAWRDVRITPRFPSGDRGFDLQADGASRGRLERDLPNLASWLDVPDRRYVDEQGRVLARYRAHPSVFGPEFTLLDEQGRSLGSVRSLPGGKVELRDARWNLVARTETDMTVFPGWTDLRDASGRYLGRLDRWDGAFGPTLDAHLVEAIDPRLLLGLLAACVAGRETRGGT